jgi:hypothetical protein
MTHQYDSAQRGTKNRANTSGFTWQVAATATIFVNRTGYLAGKNHYGYQNRFAPVPTVSQSKPSM